MTQAPAPRALSVTDQHPDARRIRVSVNDIPQQFVIAYDCDAGWVQRYERTPLDSFVSTWNGYASVEIVRGDVTAVLR